MSIKNYIFETRRKSPITKAFSSTFFSKLVQAVIPPQHDAFAGVQSSCGALKHFALKCKSEMFNCVLPINSHTRRFGLSVSSRRCPSSFHESYRMGRTSASTSLIPQLVQALIPPQHDASAGVQSSSGALKHLALKSKSEMFSCVLPINLHILRDAFEGISQPAVLSSIRSPTLDSI